MHITLSFSKEEAKEVKKALREFPARETKSQYEAARTEVNDCSVTLYTSGKLLIQGEKAEKTKEKLLHNLGLEGEVLLGIDEAGRGENFGILTVAGVWGDTNKLREIRDSKKMRDIQAAKKIVLRHAKDHFVAKRTPFEIDSARGKGVSLNVIELEMIAEIVQNFREKGFKGRILVDGKALMSGLKGLCFEPKADDNNPVVAAASILARAARDESTNKNIRKSWRNS